jgi:hypothetical protein
MWCKRCGNALNALNGLSEPRCPQCGRDFDPLYSSTFSRTPVLTKAGIAKRWAIVFVVLSFLNGCFWYSVKLEKPTSSLPIDSEERLVLFAFTEAGPLIFCFIVGGMTAPEGVLVVLVGVPSVSVLLISWALSKGHRPLLLGYLAIAMWFLVGACTAATRFLGIE